MGGRESCVFVWSDRAVFVGESTKTSSHSHNAIEVEIAVGRDSIDLSTPAGDRVTRVRGAIVRADARHRIDADVAKVAFVYVDPLCPIGRGLTRWLGDRELVAIPDEIAGGLGPIFGRLLDAAAGMADARAAIDRLLDALELDVPIVEPDERVLRAIALIEEGLAEPPAVGVIAERVGLSERRLSHVFKKQTGVSVRRYVLWLRLRKALVLALSGSSMTEAAHEAGFADAAHFTRTCQRMFGLPPTAFAPTDAVFVA